ncbi:MAG: VOC family protein [Propionibacteriaceae bacterium]|nr:VOC family protein [Propionibacteriaceae bacterium]
MHLDHVIYASGPAGLASDANRLAALLHTSSIDGGVHPSFGTRMRLIPLAQGRYIEIVEVLDHPAADKAPYGQAVRHRSRMGGGWLGWAVSVDDLGPIEGRLGRSAVNGARHFPDGRVLEWRQLGVRGLIADPQLPFFVEWRSPASVLPSALSSDIALTDLELAGSSDRLAQWLDHPVAAAFDGVTFQFNAANGYPALTAAIFETAAGPVRI